MCLILLAWQAHPEYPLIVAANRDEFFDRPTASAQFWPENPALLAGRDLLAGGTWLGITRSGRFAALTNYREIKDRPSPPTALSRGRLVSDFLQGDGSSSAYLAALAAHADDYQAFNLICGSLADGLWYYSNRDQNGGFSAARPAKALSPGIYGLSNNLLDTPWPKVAQGKSALARALATLPREAPLFELLRDDRTHADDQLPRTGISLEWERALSAAFIRAPHYGTRSSTVLLCDRRQIISFDEQSYRPDGAAGTPPAASQRSRFRFKLDTDAC